VIRDKIKKYPTWARGITTDSKGANLLGGIRYFTIRWLWGDIRIPLCITIREFEPNSAFYIISGVNLSGLGGTRC
jgi:hypothetical protein